MFIRIGEGEFDLKTNLGTVKRIEERFKMPITGVFSHLGEAHVSEIISLLSFGLGGMERAKEIGFVAAVEDELDYAGLWEIIQPYIASMIFSGTPERQEEKIEKSDFGEDQKNVFRGLLGLPNKMAPDMSIPEI